MANTDLIIPIVVAIIGLLGSALSLFLSWRTERRTHKREVASLTAKYAQPLLVAAYDLQQRVFELVEYPISRQHLTTQEGLDDLKIYTCYLLAQYLAFAHILRTKTAYLSFTENRKLKRLRTIMYMIDEELDRRREPSTWNVGVWPAARVLVSERMLVKGDNAKNDDSKEGNAKGDHGDDSLDGGFGVEVKGFDQFYKQWSKEFRQPMGYWCEWIDDMLKGRLNKKSGDAPLRCLQHLLVDLVDALDSHRTYVPEGRQALKCKSSSVDCDCYTEKGQQVDKRELCGGSQDLCREDHRLCRTDHGVCRTDDDFDKALKARQMTRLGDKGLWPVGGLHADKRPDDNTIWDKNTSLKEAEAMTYKIRLE